MSEGNEGKLFCPQCKEWREKHHFQGIPIDLRCGRCVSMDEAMTIHDLKVEKAQQIVAQVFDGVETGRRLRPLEQMLEAGYDAFGGPHAFMELFAELVKNKADEPGGRGRTVAINACLKFLSLHGKVDKLRIEEDWNSLTKAEIEAKLSMRIAAILAESALPDAKKSATKLLGGND